MPEPMTPEEAEAKTCPFMSGHGEPPTLTCHADSCACWGWVDSVRGQVSRRPKDREITEVSSDTELPRENKPDGVGWHYQHMRTSDGNDTKKFVHVWWRHKVVGPRRGMCEAMSPNITVESREQ